MAVLSQSKKSESVSGKVKSEQNFDFKKLMSAVQEKPEEDDNLLERLMNAPE